MGKGARAEGYNQAAKALDKKDVETDDDDEVEESRAEGPDDPDESDAEE
jgi:hypothetical protein